MTRSDLALTSMATEDLLVNDSSYRQAVETVGESLPQLDAVSPFAYNGDTN